jgi:hypothetical protein
MVNTITTNILPVVGGNFQVRYRKVSGGIWSGWATMFGNTYSFTTSDPVGTNYEISIQQECKPGISPIYTYFTNVSCFCNIVNLSNLIIGSCDPNTNTFSVSLDVEYVCMRNDQNVITSVIKATIDNNDYYFNPTLTSGIQNISIPNIVADNSVKQITVTCTAA